MFIHEYLSNDYPTFSLEESAEEAYVTAKEFEHTHVFILENESLVGSIAIDEFNFTAHQVLKDFQNEMQKFAILETESLLNSVALFNQFESNVIPIIDSNEKYLGYIAIDDIINNLSKSALFGEDGVILIIQHNNLHFSLSEITQIVEANNTKLYGLYVSAIYSDYVHITLKISAHNLGIIRDDFNRYGYEIVHQFYSDVKQEHLKNRYDFVKKYLEI